MTQEDKDLLLKDLCSRLPYNLIVHVHDVIEYNTCLREEYLVRMKTDKITLKPYLRSMSSMTEEEKKKFDDFCVIDEFVFEGNTEIGHKNQAIIMSDGIDYLNSIHVDYRGLIPMGLAIEAPKGMYNFN